jgi:hypothetical protein
MKTIRRLAGGASACVKKQLRQTSPQSSGGRTKGKIRMIFLASLIALSNTIGTVSCPIPLAKGNTWIYEGSVSWTLKNSDSVQSKHMRWTTEVLDVSSSGENEAALLSGFVFDLAWYDPSEPNRFTVIVRRGSDVYVIRGEDRADAERIFHLAQHPDFILEKYRIFLSLPLAEGKEWGGDTARHDGMYCWAVVSDSIKPLQIRNVSFGAPQESLTLWHRTAPDHEIVEIVPELGIIRYVYEHHGTVSSADVHLVEFHSGAPQ